MKSNSEKKIRDISEEKKYRTPFIYNNNSIGQTSTVVTKDFYTTKCDLASEILYNVAIVVNLPVIDKYMIKTSIAKF